MIPRILFVLYLIVFTICAINPYARDVWWAENAAVWVVIIPLVILYVRGVRFSNMAYIFMSIFIILHTIGGHFTFERVPFDWFNNFFGFERNMYDRVAHFSVGFYALPVYEYLITRKLVAKKIIAGLFALFAIVTVAAFYELIEWWYAVSSDPAAGIAVLGSQGDIWDAQKDMLCDTLGALLVLAIVSIQSIIGKRYE